MKNSAISIAVILLLSLLFFASCTDETTPDPCNGLGVLNVTNKLDSTVAVKITETHTTVSIKKDFTYPFSLTGNQPYTLTIDGPNYHKDTTIMILSCDNQLFVVKN